MAANQFTDSNLDHLEVPNVSGVYLLRDTVTGATYIGASTKVRTRISQHFCDMRRRPKSASYRTFAGTLAAHGAKVFAVELLEACDAQALAEAEKRWVQQLRPTENSYLCIDGRLVYAAETRSKKAAAAARLWADPEYREKAIAVRIGKGGPKGYKCTPEQVENRKRAARISNAKRAAGAAWKELYAARYPEHIGDLHG